MKKISLYFVFFGFGFTLYLLFLHLREKRKITEGEKIALSFYTS